MEGDTEVAPGVRVTPRGGHTISHQIVEISHGDESVVYLGDFIPTHHHLRTPFIMAYDLYPLTTLNHKLETLPGLARPGVTVVFEHDTEIPLATLRQENGKIVAGRVDDG